MMGSGGVPAGRVAIAADMVGAAAIAIVPSGETRWSIAG
jgi:hypothetical protein